MKLVVVQLLSYPSMIIAAMIISSSINEKTDLIRTVSYQTGKKMYLNIVWSKKKKNFDSPNSN